MKEPKIEFKKMGIKDSKAYGLPVFVHVYVEFSQQRSNQGRVKVESDHLRLDSSFGW